MTNVIEIKRRIEAIQKTRKITSAMETVSSVKMRHALALYESNRPYFEMLTSVVGNALSGVKNAEAVLSAHGGEKYVIVMASDKGLCLGFNHDICKLADGIIDEDSKVIAIGKTVAERFCSHLGLDTRFVSYGYAPTYAGAKEIAESALFAYNGGFASSISIVYSKMKGSSSCVPTVIDVLPIKAGADSDSDGAFSGVNLEPSPKELLDKLLPLYVTGAVYGAMLSSSAAEHVTRCAAMSASNKNADDMLRVLGVEYNSARQALVTQQMTEIAGATAVTSDMRR